MHENLKAWRRATGLSQQKVADMLGVTGATVSRWETGEGGITLQQFKALADLYNASPFELLVPPESREKATSIQEAFLIVSKMDPTDAAKWLAIGKTLADRTAR